MFESLKNYLDRFEGHGVHVAVLVEPYLTYILEGKKTIESRFSKNRIAPFGKVCSGDIVFLKKSGGPIVGYFRVGEVLSFRLDGPASVAALREKYNDRLLADDAFWASKSNSPYATLMLVEEVHVFAPIEIHAKNRQSWLTYSPK